MSEKRTLTLVRKYVYENISNKYEDPAESEQYTDMFMEKLYIEVWEMNRKRIENELQEECRVWKEREQERLEKEYILKETTQSLKNFQNILFEGIVVATLVGLIINQVTELILSIKQSLQTSSNISIYTSTIVCIILMLLPLIFILGKHFVDSINKIANQFNE